MQSGSLSAAAFFRNGRGGYIANDSSLRDNGRAHKTRFLSGVGESLRLQPDFGTVGRHEVTARGGGGDVADDVHKAQPHDLLLHRKRHGEEQFVVLAAV